MLSENRGLDMNHRTIGILKAVLVVLGVGIALYCLHLFVQQDTTLSEWKPKGANEFVLLAIMGLSAIWLILGETVGLNPRSAGNGRELAGVPQDASRQRLLRKPSATWWAGIAFLVIYFPAWLLFGHYFLSMNSKPLWFDTYWPVLVPVALGAMGLWWLYDTVFGRIIEGTATGKSPALHRAKLIAKRFALLVLVFAALTLATLRWGWTFQNFVTDPAEKQYLNGVFALLLSLSFISRYPSFDTENSGTSRYQ